MATGSRRDRYEPTARSVGVMRSDSGHKSEGDNKELIAAVVADVQDPVAAILEAGRLSETAHDTGRLITCLNEIVYQGARAIDENLPRVGAVEIHLGHFSVSFESVGSYEMSAAQFSGRDRRKDGSSDAVRIWNHIQVVMRGKRIICVPRGLSFAGEIVRFNRRFRASSMQLAAAASSLELRDLRDGDAWGRYWSDRNSVVVPCNFSRHLCRPDYGSP
jgi:hypothetical protein